VVALDLDLEAPGLHQKLGSQEVLNRAESGTLRGAVDELLDALEDEPIRHDLRKTAIEVDLPPGRSGSLLLIPAGSAPSQAYWAALERLNHALRSNRRNGGLAEAVLELQARIKEEFAPDFLLIDSRTGITELGGLATSLLADRVVCLTTTSPESVDGTRVVVDALRAAPRLSSQRPLRIELLITRVTPESWRSRKLLQLQADLGDFATPLPHDSAFLDKERLLGGGERPRSAGFGDSGGPKEKLFSATLNWIAKSFPGHARDAERARQRMEAIYHVWQDLVSGGKGVAWPPNQLRERVRFTVDDTVRQADIVVYDALPEGSSASPGPLMIIEYVDGEDHDTVAQWWLTATQTPVVAVLWYDGGGASSHGVPPHRRLYSSQVARNDVHSSDRRDFPLPLDFTALPDPTDVSADALIGAIRRGHSAYVDRLIGEWARCSAFVTGEGAAWWQRVAGRILDELSTIDDVGLAIEVLSSASEGLRYRSPWIVPYQDKWFNDLVLAGLFSPLLWRLPPDAAVWRMYQDRQRRHSSGDGLALALLARDILGLRYDPDGAARAEIQKELDDNSENKQTGRVDLSFEISQDMPPRGPTDVAAFVSELIAASSLATTGLLGNYDPQSGRVTLYENAISLCADDLALRARHVGSVTLISETLRGLTHLARDLDGRIWDGFPLTGSGSPASELEWSFETLIQYFTYQHILRLRDSALLHAFEEISAHQMPSYREWQRLRSLPLEDARARLMSIRRGTVETLPQMPRPIIPEQK
jgi:hypothetical protein